MKSHEDSITLRLPQDLRKWARIIAAQKDVSLSEYVRDLIAAERRKAEKKAAA